MKLIVYILLQLVLHLLFLHIFNNGFLLSRSSLPSKSEEMLEVSTKYNIIVIIIDALRFDFHSKLASLNLTNNHLFHFIADPPTTTMQRLKALTTGSLPTFIDAGNNFASPEILEDNWVDQCKLHNKSMAFLGDDTWDSLYPLRFGSLNFPFPSLNVFDFHTVDQGVINNIFPLLGNSNVIIGHLLGVDHIGHRIGPDNEEMDKKLAEMDNFLSKIMSNLAENDIVILMGDHGMDTEGNHGGDSDLEIDATLYIHTKTPFGVYNNSQDYSIWDRLHNQLSLSGVGQYEQTFLAFDKDKKYPSISQIDLVPSISAILGIPIPFGNLGSIIPQLFINNIKNSTCDAENDFNSLKNLEYLAYSNSKQIFTLINELTNDLSFADIEYFSNMFWKIEKQKHINYNSTTSKCEELQVSLERQIQFIVDNYVFMRDVLKKCRLVWAQFNVKLIIVGILGVFVSGCLVFYFIFKMLAKKDLVGFSLTLVFILSHSLIFMTNSFIINEEKVVFFLLQSLNFFFFLQTNCFTSIIMVVLTRITFMSKLCREEQYPDCISTFYSVAPFHIFDNVLVSSGTSTSVSAVGVFCLFIMVIVLPRLVHKVTNQWYSFTTSSFISVYWFLEYMESSLEIVKVSKVSFGLLAYGSAIFLIIKSYFRSAEYKINSFYSFFSIFQLPPGAWIMGLGILHILLAHKRINENSHLKSIYYGLLGYHLFFSTGHLATFPSIQFQAGFIGLLDFNFYISGFLVALNTVGPFVFVGILVPLVSSNKNILLFVAYKTAVALLAMIFAGIFRRHMMVWKVFAPRYMMAAVDLLVSDIGLLLGLIFRKSY
jgi:phosphatidylinositol glycan class O